MIYFLHVSYSIFNTSNKTHTYVSAAIGFLLCIFFIYHVVKFKKIDKNAKDGIIGFIIPVIIISCISFFTSKFIYNIETNSVINQSIARLSLYISGFIMAYYSVKIFGEKTLKLIIIAGTISYISVIIKWIIYSDINQVFNIFNNSVNGVSLEVHGLTYIFALILLYYIMNNTITNKKKIMLLAFLMFIIVLGNKRIIYGALIISIGLYYILNRNCKSSKIIEAISIVLSFVPLFYVILIKYGIIETLFFRLNITDNSRLMFWNYFNEYYKVTPTYWGRGIEFTDIIMEKTDTMYELGITIKTQIHNDILKQYIGWGFIPFLYYYIMYSYFQVESLIKKGIDRLPLKYLIIIIFSIFIFAFDNMYDGIEYHYIFFVIWFLLTRERTQNIEGENEEKIKLNLGQ